MLILYSRWSCWEVGIWSSWSEDSCCLDGWPCTVSELGSNWNSGGMHFFLLKFQSVKLL